MGGGVRGATAARGAGDGAGADGLEEERTGTGEARRLRQPRAYAARREKIEQAILAALLIIVEHQPTVERQEAVAAGIAGPRAAQVDRAATDALERVGELAGNAGVGSIELEQLVPCGPRKVTHHVPSAEVGMVGAGGERTVRNGRGGDAASRLRRVAVARHRHGGRVATVRLARAAAATGEREQLVAAGGALVVQEQIGSQVSELVRALATPASAQRVREERLAPQRLAAAPRQEGRLITLGEREGAGARVK